MDEQMRENESSKSGLVDRGVSALREKDAAIPDLPESLFQSTLLRLHSAEAPQKPEATRWSMQNIRRFSIAAALLIIAGLAITWATLGRGTQVAFADVLVQIHAAKAVRCNLTIFANQGNEAAFDVLMVEPGWVVEKGHGVTMIMNSPKHEMLTLTSASKQALLIDVTKDEPPTDTDPQKFNLLETFKNVDGKQGKPLGERDIDGHHTAGFEVVKNGMQLQVWADTKTQLPVLVESVAETTTPAADTKVGEANPFFQLQARFTSFNWNPTYDPAELTTTVPAGYAVTNSQMNLAAPSEQDVLVMLKTFADLNGGTLPSNLGANALGQVIAKKMQATGKLPKGYKTLPPPERQKVVQQVTAEALTLAEPIVRGWSFIGDAKYGSDWRYAPGATAGEKGIPVLWYKPAGKATWRVINADWSLHDQPAAPPGGDPVHLFSLDPTP